MQAKLATWSTSDPHRQFDRVFRLIAQQEWLLEAARITLSSKGAATAGVDGINKEVIENDLLQFVEEIRESLLAESYKPLPARRVYIPKPNGRQRPLGIPTLRDRIVQRAMLMAMEPIWESDFHRLSYGFRPERSVHHAIRTVKFQLQDSTETVGRWVIEGDLSSYFDTVHHKLLMNCVRKRIRDRRFMMLLWRFLKAGHIDKGLFHAASGGVPQGGVLSPLLSNIMLNEFDWWMDEHFVSKKARKDRWYWNDSIRRQRPIALREERAWIPAVSYCRYADDFIVIVKGNKRHAESIRERLRRFLEEDLLLVMNMEKTHITHVDDGFTFLGHRIVRKRGPRGIMRPVTTIPKEKIRAFAHAIADELSGNYCENKIAMMEKLNRRLTGWANFYQFTDYTSYVYRKLDRVVFWKFGHWLARKYRTSIKSLMIQFVRRPAPGAAKIWVVYGRNLNGNVQGVTLRRLVTSPKLQFRWRNPESNPYVIRDEVRNTVTSRYRDVAMAMSHA